MYYHLPNGNKCFMEANFYFDMILTFHSRILAYYWLHSLNKLQKLQKKIEKRNMLIKIVLWVKNTKKYRNIYNCWILMNFAKFSSSLIKVMLEFTCTCMYWPCPHTAWGIYSTSRSVSPQLSKLHVKSQILLQWRS